MKAVREQEMNYQVATDGVSQNGAVLMGDNDNQVGLVQNNKNNQGMNIQANVADDAAVSFGADILFGGGIATALSMAHNGMQMAGDFQKENSSNVKAQDLKVPASTSFSAELLNPPKNLDLHYVNSSSTLSIKDKRNKLQF